MLLMLCHSIPTPSTFHEDADNDNNTIQQYWIAKAQQVASWVEVVIFFLGLAEILESEGFDQLSLQLPKQHLALCKAIC
jgi:hypothetical protein